MVGIPGNFASSESDASTDAELDWSAGSRTVGSELTDLVN